MIVNYEKGIDKLLQLLPFFAVISVVLFDYSMVNANKELYVNHHYINPGISIFLSSLMAYLPDLIVAIITLLIFPALIYFLIVKIFQSSVPILWAVFLSLVSLSIIENFPLREFLFNLISGSYDKNSLTNNGRFPIIFDFPIPQFSTLWCLSIFYFLEKNHIKELSLLKIILISFFVGLTFYVNAIDAPFVIVYVLSIFASSFFGLRKKGLFLRLFLGSIIISLLSISALSSGVYSIPIDTTNSFLPIYHLVVYFFIPLSLIFIQYLFLKIDPYELLLRFRHVYLLLLSEAIVVLGISQGFINLDFQVLNSRIIQFFFHAYYYVPVIYYATRSELFIVNKNKSNLLIQRFFIKALQIFFGRHSKFFIVPLIILMIIYNTQEILL